jgi:predicted sugar kinase
MAPVGWGFGGVGIVLSAPHPEIGAMTNASIANRGKKSLRVNTMIS